MDKPRSVMRGSSSVVLSNANKRRHVQKKHLGRRKTLFGVFTASIRGDLQFSEKSKKVRSLSAVGKALPSNHQHCEMGCHVSEKQAHDPPPSSTVTKRFKIPKNFLNGCNGVHHAAVPRKLRSAMKKRSRESMLLDSEKVNHKINGIESPGKDGVKKSKKQGVSVSGAITKDEEEVVETLYALAGMFPNNGSNHNNSRELNGKSMPENSSVLQDLKENTNAAHEGSATAQGPESSPGEASRVSSLNETSRQEQPERAAFLMASHSTTPTINPQSMAVVVKCENCNNAGLHDSELCLAMGLNMTTQSRVSQIERKPDVEFETATDVDNVIKQKQHLIKGQIQNEGLTLWPSFCSVASPGQANHHKSIAAKAPDWLEAAICASKQDLMETSTCSSNGKISKDATYKRSWKRCAAHVYISHYIKSSDVRKGQVNKESELYECHQMRAHEGSKYGVLFEVHRLNRMRNGVTSVTVRNPHESRNGILQQQCLYSDISLATPTPEVHDTQKQQSFNFLSLSSASDGLKVDNSYNKIEPLSKLQVPYLQSLAQKYGVMPLPTLQSQYASTSCHAQLSVAAPQVRLQQPHYYGSMLRGTQYSSTVSSKQEQQSFWGVQQAAQGRSCLNSNIMRTQYQPNWQSGRRHHHSYAGNPCVQAAISHSPASQEIFGSKITSISISGKQRKHQQQQLIPPIQDLLARPTSPFCL